MSNSSNNIIRCFLSGRDLSQAEKVNYTAEGPICSICLLKSTTLQWKLNDDDDDLDQFDQVILE